MGKDVVAHAGVAEAIAVAAPDDPVMDDRIERLARKVEKSRLQLEEAEAALAQAIAETEGD